MVKTFDLKKGRATWLITGEIIKYDSHPSGIITGAAIILNGIIVLRKNSELILALHSNIPQGIPN